MSAKCARKALVYDEGGFARVCSAVLEINGCCVDVVRNAGAIADRLSTTDIGVVITSYPYGASILDEIGKRQIPAIVLFDDVDERFIEVLRQYDNSYCLVKPLDYDRFKGLVIQLLNGRQVSRDEYSIV